MKPMKFPSLCAALKLLWWEKLIVAILVDVPWVGQQSKWRLKLKLLRQIVFIVLLAKLANGKIYFIRIFLDNFYHY